MYRTQFSVNDYVNAMEKELNLLRSLPKEQAQKKAMKSLCLSGLVTEDGKIKKEICTVGQFNK